MEDNLAHGSVVPNTSPPISLFSFPTFPQKLAGLEGINSRAARVSALEPLAYSIRGDPSLAKNPHSTQ
jgi:hypothetical protein